MASIDLRTPRDLRQAWVAAYNRSWRSWLLDDVPSGFTFTLRAPRAEALGEHFERVAAWCAEWVEWEARTAGASLETVTRRTRFGPQALPSRAVVEGWENSVRLDVEIARHWRRAERRLRSVRDLPGHDAEVVRPRLAEIVDLADADFEILCAAVRWFAVNPRSGLMGRQVPVLGMHTKWLAQHRRLVVACLGLGSGNDDPQLNVLGLREMPVSADLIVADPAIRLTIAGLRHLRAPAAELAVLPLTPSEVVIVENKESALMLPDRAGCVYVHSLGNNLPLLAQLPWLRGPRVRYWGDLDRAGFALLSQARSVVPGLESTLMDVETLRRYQALAVPDSTKAATPLDTLTEGELEALAALAPPGGVALRLEQERLPYDVVVSALWP
ncbi:hypothetical protein JT358_15540 [Micrococcales bacterium 31B]|nr:hypothetical protein [Micrococcales bacterium 31B]